MARAAPQRDDRRGRIATALYRCISRQGYANTSLANVADEAGMSPSHVGYYFDNKAAILEYYGAAICEQNLAALPDPGEPDLERLLDALARFCLGAGQTSTGLLGVIQELTGLAVHDPRLHQIKAKHSTAWREYLESLFERAKRPAGITAREAAWLAHAILVGLNTNALFDRALDRERAHGLFRGALRALAGVDESSLGGATRTRVPTRRRGRR
jgi:AcrR family transcriptional regulator